MEIEKRNYNKFGYPKMMIDIKNRSFINHLEYKLKKFEGKMDRISAAEIKKMNNKRKVGERGLSTILDTEKVTTKYKQNDRATLK